MKHEDIISKLSLEEKCHLLSGRDFWQTQSVKRLGIESMTLSDGPHGIRKQEGAGDQLGLNGSVPATCYPTAATMANSWDPELGEELGRHLGTEAASQDVCVLLGPGMNVKRSCRPLASASRRWIRLYSFTLLILFCRLCTLTLS